jgi:hypothetical protein
MVNVNHIVKVKDSDLDTLEDKASYVIPSRDDTKYSVLDIISFTGKSGKIIERQVLGMVNFGGELKIGENIYTSLKVGVLLFDVDKNGRSILELFIGNNYEFVEALG